MGWGTFRHRPMGTGMLGGQIKWRRSRLIVAKNATSVVEQQQVEKVIAPGGQPLDVSLLGDVNQRVYLKANSMPQKWTRTIRVRASMFSASSVDGPWTEIAASVVTDFGYNMGAQTYNQFLDPDDYQAFAFISPGTTVYQPGEYWAGPFEILHEVWANAYIYNRSLSAEGPRGQAPMHVSHYMHDIESTRKPRWTGG